MKYLPFLLIILAACRNVERDKLTSTELAEVLRQDTSINSGLQLMLPPFPGDQPNFIDNSDVSYSFNPGTCGESQHILNTEFKWDEDCTIYFYSYILDTTFSMFIEQMSFASIREKEINYAPQNYIYQYKIWSKNVPLLQFGPVDTSSPEILREMFMHYDTIHQYSGPTDSRGPF